MPKPQGYSDVVSTDDSVNYQFGKGVRHFCLINLSNTASIDFSFDNVIWFHYPPTLAPITLDWIFNPLDIQEIPQVWIKSTNTGVSAQFEVFAY